MKISPVFFGVVLVFVLLIGLCQEAKAQFISAPEPFPFSCLILCPGDQFSLKIPRIENLPPGSIPQGSTLQVLLSGPTGSFATGTTVLENIAWRNFTSGTFTQGAYVIQPAVSADIVATFQIPANAPSGTAYTVRMRTSNGFVARDIMNSPCAATPIRITAPPANLLPQIAPTTFGAGKWLAHMYTWKPTQDGVLTPGLIARQDFFNPANYLGHSVYTPLNFDLDFSATGSPGLAPEGTSIACGKTENYSLRLMRTEDFVPGFYEFTIAGDDGLRFSIDSGRTWLLDSFREQQYAGSGRSTFSDFPQGVCMGGPTTLIVEYFQRPSNARLTFTSTLKSPAGQSFTVADVAVCTGAPATFGTTGATPGYTYQWQLSVDGGTTYNNLFDDAIYAGTQSASLILKNTLASMDGYQYRVLVTSPCLRNVPSTVGKLSLRLPSPIVSVSGTQNLCLNPTATFSVVTLGGSYTYQWQENSSGTFANVPGAAAQNFALQVSVAPAPRNTYYRCIVTGPCGAIPSDSILLIPKVETRILSQPRDTASCSQAITLSVRAESLNPAYTWQTTTDTTTAWGPLPAGGPYAGQTTADLTITPNQSLSGQWYRVLVQGNCGAGIFSKPARLVVPAQPSISTQPTASLSSCVLPVAISVVATGAGLSYTWQQSQDTAQGWQPLAANGPYAQTNTAALQITASPSASSLFYRALLTGTCGTLASAAAKLSPCCTPAIYNIITNNPAYPQNREFIAAPNCDFEAFSLRVYSRWGRLVYSTTDATKIWNGSRGQTDVAGTYFYQLTYTTGGQKTEKKGYVELVR